MNKNEQVIWTEKYETPAIIKTKLALAWPWWSLSFKHGHFYSTVIKIYFLSTPTLFCLFVNIFFYIWLYDDQDEDYGE